MLTQLQKLQAAIADSKTANDGGDSGKNTFSHKKMAEGQSARLRFVPDTDPDNPLLPWIETAESRIAFQSAINVPEGFDGSKMAVIKVPCSVKGVDDDACQVRQGCKTFFAAKEDTIGRKCWPKPNYIMQGFVNDNPLGDTETDVLRRFALTQQIYTAIGAGLGSLEADDAMPQDIEKGLDFILKAGEQGGFKSYSASCFARSSTALTKEQKAAAKDAPMLKSLVAPLPTADQQAVLIDMVIAANTGQPYDYALWGHLWTPFGLEKKVVNDK